MKRAFWFVIIFLILAIAAFYFLQDKLFTKERGVFDLVPEDAVMVIEASNIVGVWNNFTTTSIWKNLSQSNQYLIWQQDLEQLDSIAGGSGELDKFFKGRQFLVSTHPIAKDEYDHIFYVPVPGMDNFEALLRIIEHYKNRFSFTERIYNNIEITEIKDRRRAKIFSFIMLDNHFIGSFTPFLVEDVIRNADSEIPASFKILHLEVFDHITPNQSEARVYLNFSFLEPFVRIFLKEYGGINKTLRLFSGLTVFDLDMDDKNLYLNGFTYNQDDSYLAKVYKKQRPLQSDLKNYLPNRTSLLWHITFSDFMDWEMTRSDYIHQSDDEYKGSLEFFTQFNFNQKELYANLSGDLGLAYLESIDNEYPDKVLFLKSVNIEKTMSMFNELAVYSSKKNGEDSVYFEEFSENKLMFIEINELPNRLFGPTFSGFRNAYFTNLDNYLLISNKIQVLKTIISDFESEDTWGKSVKQNLFLQSTQEETNLSLIVNIPRAWDLIKANLNPTYQERMDKLAPQLRRFNMSAFQISSDGNEFFTSIVINHLDFDPNTLKRSNFILENEFEINDSIVSKPMIVRNHENQSLEMIVHDKSNNLSLISTDGKSIWIDSVGPDINTDLFQIDYFTNNNLQYLFATGNKVNLIDRNGNKVEGFPWILDYTIDRMAVIDYDKSKNYRIFISDYTGNLYLYDKTGHNLEGWDPKPVTGRLSSPLFHVRVRGKDCMIAVQENGIINIMNRRGKMYPGFPLDLKTKILGDIFIELGEDFSKTQLIIVTENGEIVNFNLNGLIIFRDQLIKPSREAKFWLVKERQGKGYVIVIQELNKVTVLDKNGNRIFNDNYFSHDQFSVQYYDFGTGEEVYAITDAIQGFTYLYNGLGNLVNSEPLSSSFPVAIIYSSTLSKFRVYHGHQNKLMISSFFSN